MSAADFRLKSVPDLNEELRGLLREHFNLRMQAGAGQLAKNHQVNLVRRNIARLRTVLREKAGIAQ